ncbi:hypothetical protein CHLNCDRAFT_56794 [Chlorella variabilis]|uniref:Uncharacterized protein n=1 Tax=Chlorella variabilis TaxID=554065 RepID=E1Z3Q3_CHLVA|nr:hypothetical protein CHLNCDRAFT_56794 [Chlorella variabilis]EFN59520.1 hypothetical protein CHLNCDRAFT_56794 [Chlorella variabilis]|eukprot:XP_005851622.1 hypothetical protein CHLNCDRAFT_56794 [Chlorella variabilis]
MLPVGFAATMLKLPRTAGPQRQLPSYQTAVPLDPAASESPREVLGGLPLPQARSASSRLANTQSDRAVEPQDGHAQDVLRLLNAGWFGPLSKSKAARLFSRPAAEAEAAMPPLARRGRQRQQQQPAASGDRGSDASPSTSSQRSGSSTQLAGGGSGSRGNHPVAMPSCQQQQQQAAIQELPGIGTWAGRYRLFGGRNPPEERQAVAVAQQQQTSPPVRSGAGQAQQCAAEQQERGGGDGDMDGSPVVLRPGGYVQPAAAAQPGEGRLRGNYGSPEAQEDAWRWRFSRKWATEQKRYYEQPEQPTSLVSDDLDAMEFTQACGTGLNLQVMPTSAARRPIKAVAASTDEDGALGHENSASSLSLCQFDVDHSQNTMGLLSAEMSPGNSAHGAIAAGRLLHRTGSGGGGWQRPQHQHQHQHQHGQAAPSPRLPSATKSVLSMASKAQDLLQKQGAIEQEVQDRWERSCSASDAWAGRNLRGVQIDMWGRFKYCVLRVSDGAGRTRFIVRGRSGATPAQLLEAANQEAAGASRSGALPAVMVEVVGAGVMEWREDTERELHLMPSILPPGGVGLDATRTAGGPDSPTKSAYLGDMSGLTASLVRQALPCHFRITTSGSASRANGMAAVANRV